MPKARDAFRTISEVSDWLDAPAHVLRFWESKFSQIKPVKRAGGRRYYRPADMALLSGIQKLLHEDGMTIKAVQDLLKTKGIRHVAAFGADPMAGETPQIERPRRAKAEAPKPAEETAADTAPPEPSRQAPPDTHAEPQAEDPAPTVESKPPAQDEPVDYGPLFAFMNEPAEKPAAKEAAPAKPKSLRASIPDDPLDDDIAASPGLLTAIAKTPRSALTAKQHSIAPHLKALRDICARMTSG